VTRHPWRGGETLRLHVRRKQVWPRRGEVWACGREVSLKSAPSLGVCGGGAGDESPVLARRNHDSGQESKNARLGRLSKKSSYVGRLQKKSSRSLSR
jgi:hypothetical protein